MKRRFAAALVLGMAIVALVGWLLLNRQGRPSGSDAS